MASSKVTRSASVVSGGRSTFYYGNGICNNGSSVVASAVGGGGGIAVVNGQGRGGSFHHRGYGSGSGGHTRCATLPSGHAAASLRAASATSSSASSSSSASKSKSLLLSQHMEPMDFSPEDLASQLTLLDHPVFKSIQPEELMSCSWNKKNKLEVAPHVVSFIRRFNHVSFWVVQEVLRFEVAKQRAEVMAHFIKVAKKLHDLENLHSQFAILSALQTAAIFRLSKTWSHLSRKDKQTFDKLADLFSERDNFARLREHMNGIALKHQACIPYLGLYLTDLVYVDMAHPCSGGMESQQRQFKMNNILRIVSELQQASYSHLPVLQTCTQYLRSIRYIDELQKFIEEDNFKLSLKLEEPKSNNSNAPSSSSSKESVVSGSLKNFSGRDPNLMAELNLSPAKVNSGGSSIIRAGKPSTSSSSTFVPGHRKSRSDGASIFLSCTGGQQEDLLLPSWASGKLSNAGSDEQFRHHLLDDSLLEEPSCGGGGGEGCGMEATGSKSEKGGSEKMRFVEVKGMAAADLLEVSPGTKCSFQGCIKRKTLIKDGRRPTMSGWQRYWLQIWGSSLVFFSPRTLTKGLDRRDFRAEPNKCQVVAGWLVMVADSTLDNLSFQLTDPVRRNVYRFRAPTPELARTWVNYLHLSVRGQYVQSTPANLITFE